MKTRLSHWSCFLRSFSNEILHDHYIRPNPNAMKKTHDCRLSLFEWVSGFKFFKWSIIPKKINQKTRHIFDQNRYIICYISKSKIGKMK